MRNKRISIKKVIFYICLLGLIILLVMPILWAMLLSLKTNNEIVNSPLSLPQTISFENYQRAIDTIDFSKMYFNTILLVVISTFFSILFTFMSSFAIAEWFFETIRHRKHCIFPADRDWHPYLCTTVSGIPD